MSDPKPDYILQNSLDIGCGVVIGGKRWLVKEMTIETHPDEKDVGMFLALTPWESIDPTLYRIKPKRRRKREGKQP